jgi:MFS family permease
MNSRMLQTILIALTSLATISSTDIFLPSLPSMASYFHTSDAKTQLTIPIFLLGSLIGGPILGVFSDYFPRKRVMLVGLAIFLLGTALCLYSPLLSFLLFGRFIQGFGSIVPSVVGWAIIQDLYPGDQSAKVMSWMGSVICIAPLVAPALGGYIHVTIGWKGNFFLLFLCAALMFFLILISKFKTQTRLQQERFSPLNSLKIYRNIITNTRFISYISLFALLSLAEWCYLTLIPFYFENSLHLPPHIFGLYISGGASFYLLGAAFTPMILNWLGLRKTLSSGIILSLIGSSLLFFISLLAPTFPLFIAFSVGLYFFGTAIVWGPSVSKALQCFEDSRGAASAVRSFLITAASVMGGMMGSIMDDSSILFLSLFMLTMAMGCWIIYQKVQKLERI